MSPSPNVRQLIRRCDLLTLRLFVSVVEERSIGRAATRECLAPSAATKRIQALEESLGVRLFFRNSRATVLTPAGEVVAQHAVTILTSIDSLGQTLGALGGDLEGRLLVRATPSSIVEFMAADLAGFARAFPLVRLDLQSSHTAEVLRSVQTGRADVGICAAPAEVPAALHESEYRQDRLVAVMQRLHPLASLPAVGLVQLLDCDMIGWSPEGSLMNQLERQAATLGREFSPRFRVPSIDAARALVRAGLGVAVMPEGMVTPFEDTQVVCAVPLSEPWAKRRLCAYTQTSTSHAAAAFIHYLAPPGQEATQPA